MHQATAIYDGQGLARTLQSECGGLGAKTGLYTVADARAVLTPDREEKRQNGRRMKDPGEPMFTLTAQDRHGVAILTKERTEYGKKIRKTYESGEVTEQRKNMTQYVPRTDGLSNTITTVQKDNYLLVEGDNADTDNNGAKL